jgi:hypothetical protein
MIVDSNDWTGADGKAWGYPTEVKRSRWTRWWLLLVNLILFSSIVHLFRDISIQASDRTMPFAIIFIVTAFVNRSPFRHKQMMVSKKIPMSSLTLKQPDEVETALFAHYNIIAHNISIILVIALFGWIAFAASNQNMLPASWRSWLTVGMAFAGILYIMPTLIAEWRVPFPPKGDEEDEA